MIGDVDREACVLLGRSYIGFDSDPAWVEAARKRVSDAAATGQGISDVDCLRLCAAPKRAKAAA